MHDTPKPCHLDTPPAGSGIGTSGGSPSSVGGNGTGYGAGGGGSGGISAAGGNGTSGVLYLVV